jgi:hypothetical protein
LDAVEAFAVERFAVERFAAGLRADVRLAPLLARFAVERFAVERFAVERFAVLRFAVDLRAPPEVARAAEPPPEPSLALHLPDITRCAASATASAIIDPSLVALDITFVAAWEAVSAASSPASRILRRADGLALIAAAAAAKPAASISLLIAAFASLSTVVLELDDLRVVEREELFRADLAIAFSPSVAE